MTNWIKDAINNAIQDKMNNLVKEAKMKHPNISPRPYFSWGDYRNMQTQARSENYSKPLIEDAEYEIVEPMQLSK